MKGIRDFRKKIKLRCDKPKSKFRFVIFSLKSISEELKNTKELLFVALLNKNKNRFK